ncbi:MAG: FkbM family methyltransferase [Chloroflexota bacterium]
MNRLMAARRAVARVLPAPLKRALRTVLPVWILRAAPRVRRFTLAMPTPPAGAGPVARPAASPARIRFEAPYRSYVPRLLEEHGVRHYEPETMAAFLAAISVLEATEAFDIGANVGVFSIVASTTTTARITGFEPTPQLAATYRAVASANGLGCEVEEIALGAERGSATLYLSARTDSSNSLVAGFRQAAGTVAVPMERLDDYVIRSGRRPAVMKVDTETTEPAVFEGGLETLRTVRPWIVCEVLAGTTETRLMALLQPLGYRFHHLGEHGPTEVDEIVGDPTYRHRDWLFTPDVLPATFAPQYAAWLAAILATP